MNNAARATSYEMDGEVLSAPSPYRLRNTDALCPHSHSVRPLHADPVLACARHVASGEGRAKARVMAGVIYGWSCGWSCGWNWGRSWMTGARVASVDS